MFPHGQPHLGLSVIIYSSLVVWKPRTLPSSGIGSGSGGGKDVYVLPPQSKLVKPVEAWIEGSLGGLWSIAMD